MTIGQLLREARLSAGLTQSEAAEQTGISQGNISGYEADQINPKVQTLQKICEVYQTTVSKLTRGLD